MTRWALISLLLLAPEPFRHRHPDWPSATAAILEHADRIMHGATIDA